MSQTDKKEFNFRDFFVSVQDALKGTIIFDIEKNLSSEESIDKLYKKINTILQHLVLYTDRFPEKKIYALIGKVYVFTEILKNSKKSIVENKNTIISLGYQIDNLAKELLRIIDPQKAFHDARLTAYYKENSEKDIPEEEWNKFFIYNNPHYVLAATIMDIFEKASSNIEAL